MCLMFIKLCCGNKKKLWKYIHSAVDSIFVFCEKKNQLQLLNKWNDFHPLIVFVSLPFVYCYDETHFAYLFHIYMHVYVLHVCECINFEQHERKLISNALFIYFKIVSDLVIKTFRFRHLAYFNSIFLMFSSISSCKNDSLELLEEHLNRY